MFLLDALGGIIGTLLAVVITLLVIVLSLVQVIVEGLTAALTSGVTELKTFASDGFKKVGDAVVNAMGIKVKEDGKVINGTKLGAGKEETKEIGETIDSIKS